MNRLKKPAKPATGRLGHVLHLRFHLPLLAMLIWGVSSPQAIAQAGGSCGGLGNAFGPYDYRKEAGNPESKQHSTTNPLYLVESRHFQPQMEALVAGLYGSEVGDELDYTLRAFPNHHRALLAMMRLGVKQKLAKPRGSRYTVDCWFERAVRFAADDAIARMLYANYLGSNGRRDDAVFHLEVALKLANDSPFSHYNIGMVFADLQIYDRALEQAHRAIELGMTRTELKERLTTAGRWRDPVPKSASDAAASASAAPAEAASAPANVPPSAPASTPPSAPAQ